MSMAPTDAVWARVRPLLGEGLVATRVAVAGRRAGPLIRLLAASGVAQWTVVGAGAGVFPALAAHFGPALPLRVQVTDADAWPRAAATADLTLVVDDPARMAHLSPQTTRLHISLPTATQPGRAVWALPGEPWTAAPPRRRGPLDGWAWTTAAPLLAGLARGLLLRETVWAAAGWSAAWLTATRAYTVGGDGDPTQTAWGDAPDHAPPFGARPRRRGTLLIVGLGSLGSVAAPLLAPTVDKLVLVDPDTVDAANVPRQCYGVAEIGQPKATTLAAMLTATCGVATVAQVAALNDEDAVAALVAAHGVTAALVTTGTHADFALARGLEAAGVPHVVGRCYARARFWEGIVVDGGGPCYGDLRGGHAAGPLPAPTPEERAAYGGELVAEPATAVETGWAAAWLARLTVQVARPPGLVEEWLLARLQAGAACLIGGIAGQDGVESAPYGVRVPGQVHAWGMAQVA